MNLVQVVDNELSSFAHPRIHGELGVLGYKKYKIHSGIRGIRITMGVSTTLYPEYKHIGFSTNSFFSNQMNLPQN